MLDGDTDLEPANDDEPAGDEAESSLGWPEGAVYRAGTSLDDREQDVGDEGEPDADREPSLGSLDPIPFYHNTPGAGSQLGWAAGGSRDFEGDGDDREPDANQEDWRQLVSLNASR